MQSLSLSSLEGFIVNGFGRALKCVHPQTEENKQSTSLWSRLFSKKNRSPSGADPSEIAGKTVQDEEDILHIPQLPSFEGKLTQSASEMLLSYLTVPYIRIPLVLNFFASQDNIPALGLLEIQSILDSVLFEPGLWHPNRPKTVPSNVPTEDRTFLATPLGLLFNELKMSPHAVIKPVTQLLENALELDPGCYTEELGFMILYVLRLVVRLEGFVLFFINYHHWDKTQVSRARWEGFCRGLESNDEHVSLMMEKRREWREMINDQVFPMLERWIEHSVKQEDMPTACLLHTHIAYLFLHVPLEEFTEKTVITLISSQIFLNAHYRFNAQNDTGKKVKRTSEGKQQVVGLGISDTEMFDLFQKQRGNVLVFLNQNGARCNEIMETIVKLVTVPSKTGPSFLASSGMTRFWRPIDGFHNIGRFIPDLTSRTAEQQEKAEKERPFTRELIGSNIEIEINIQLGTFTLNNSPMEPLDEAIYINQDFKDVLGDLSNVAAAPVKNTTKRSWVRIMGTRFDLQYWQPDERIPNIPPDFSRKYSPSTIATTEIWVAQILEPIRQKHKLLASGEIFLPAHSHSSTDPFARLMGFELERDFTQQEKLEPATQKIKSDNCYDCNLKFTLTSKRHHCYRCGNSVCSTCGVLSKVPNSSGEEVRLCQRCRLAVTPRKSLREIVVVRKHKAVHYYKIVEHGRQLYKSLLFSSNWRYCLYGIQLLIQLCLLGRHAHIVFPFRAIQCIGSIRCGCTRYTRSTGISTIYIACTFSGHHTKFW